MFHDNGFYWMMGLKCAANLHDNFESIIKKNKKNADTQTDTITSAAYRHRRCAPAAAPAGWSPP